MTTSALSVSGTLVKAANTLCAMLLGLDGHVSPACQMTRVGMVTRRRPGLRVRTSWCSPPGEVLGIVTDERRTRPLRGSADFAKRAARLTTETVPLATATAQTGAVGHSLSTNSMAFESKSAFCWVGRWLVNPVGSGNTGSESNMATLKPLLRNR